MHACLLKPNGSASLGLPSYQSLSLPTIVPPLPQPPSASPSSLRLPPRCAAILSQPPVINMDTARDEAKMVLFGAAEEVLRATGTKPQAVDILIVNCSLFNPTPSLSGAPSVLRGMARVWLSWRRVAGGSLHSLPACATSLLRYSSERVPPSPAPSSSLPCRPRLPLSLPPVQP